jgi:hypothetical protein
VLSKYFPGKYNPTCAYLNGNQQAAKAVAVTNGFSISQGYSYTATAGAKNLGSDTYTVIMFCPMLSMFYPADADSPFYSNYRQLGGIAIAMSNVTSELIPASLFVGLLASNAATASQGSRAMVELFGFQSTQELTTYIYSSKLKMEIVTPAANLVGTMYKGSFRLGSFFSPGATSPNPLQKQELTIAQLIAIANEVSSMKSEFTLQSALVNDDLHSIYGASRTNIYIDGGDLPYRAGMDWSFLSSEIVEYVVLQSPAQSITDNTTKTFSLIGVAESN